MAYSKKKKSSTKKLELARKRFKIVEEQESEIRRNTLEDTEFRSGEHWPVSIKNERDLDDRPSLTVNRIPQFIRQVTNEQRQNRPSIKVYPVDDNADKDTAKIMSGMIRHIEYSSNAEIAYDTAFEQAVEGGYGYFRVVTDYCDPLTFDQELRIEPVKDRFKVYLDPFYQMPDGSDAEWGFIAEDMPIDTFVQKYGESALAEAAGSDIALKALGDSAPGWIEGKTVRVCDYYYKEYKTKTLLLLTTGASILEDDFDEWFEEYVRNGGEENADDLVDKTRETQVCVVKACKINGVEELEETEFPGSWIPIIPVLGDDYIVNGRRILEGLVRHAKDPQRMLNYWASAETEAIALAPKAPFIAAEGQIGKEYDTQWSQANKKSFAYLTYKPTSLEDKLVPPPQRNTFEPPVQAITQARLQSSEDLKSVTGIYDQALGQPNQTDKSGRMIERRNEQSQTANFHYQDNMARSIRHLGRILVVAIPIVYDAERAAMIMGEDGETELIKINQVFDKEGKQVQYRMGFGKYDVMVDTGPSFQSRRMEAMQSILSFVEKYPAAAPMVGDLIAKNSDWPGSQEIAERLKIMLPPELKGENPLPPEAMQQIEQLKATVDQLTKDLEYSQALISEKTFEQQQKQMELESKERIEFNKMDVQMKIKTMEAQAEFGPMEREVLNDLAAEVVEISTFMKSQLNYPGTSQLPNGQGGPQVVPPEVVETTPPGSGPGQPEGT